MLLHYLLLCLHLLGACVWVGGHLVLAVRVLPAALAARDARPVREFEARYERVGLPSLAVQIVTGLWLAARTLGGPENWWGEQGPARMVQIKLLCLAGTVALAVHAKARVIPRLNDATLPVLGWHIRAVTVLAVVFVVAGASVRFGGQPWMAP